MELSGFRVSIDSGGEELKVYSIETSPDGKKATCWVPSQSGKGFVVKYTSGESSVIKDREKSAHLYVDGHRMGGSLLRTNKTCRAIDGVNISDDTIRPFVFADIQATDDDSLVDGVHTDLDEIGTICVRVFMVKSSKRSHKTKYKIQELTPAVMNERTKKGAEHCVSLGDERPQKAGRHYSMVYDSKIPDLVFEFRYRSSAMLQALGIIPPPKREAPSVIDIEDEEILPPPKRQKGEHDEDRMRSMQAELTRLRRRVGELEGKPSGVKKEVIKCEPTDIIDLT